jgi:hypothetical protein
MPLPAPRFRNVTAGQGRGVRRVLEPNELDISGHLGECGIEILAIEASMLRSITATRLAVRRCSAA